ncbi:hypothetical protein ACL655_20415 [Klebsiella quasipneumoniae subsp. similipneumoniae]
MAADRERSLGTWLQALQPDWDLTMVEKLDGVALESSTAGIMPVLALGKYGAELYAGAGGRID